MSIFLHSGPVISHGAPLSEPCSAASALGTMEMAFAAANRAAVEYTFEALVNAGEKQ